MRRRFSVFRFDSDFILTSVAG